MFSSGYAMLMYFGEEHPSSKMLSVYQISDYIMISTELVTGNVNFDDLDKLYMPVTIFPFPSSI